MLRRPTTIRGKPARAPISLPPSRRTGQPAPDSVRALCERARGADARTWGRYKARCTGQVDWDLPGRSAVGKIPLLGTAIGVATSLIPGAGLVAGALGLGAGAAPARSLSPASTTPAGGGMKLIGYYGPYPVVILTGYGGAR